MSLEPANKKQKLSPTAAVAPADNSTQEPSEAPTTGLLFTTDMVKHQVAVAVGFRDQWKLILCLAWILRYSGISFVLEAFGIDVLLIYDDEIIGAGDAKTSSKSGGHDELSAGHITQSLASTNKQLERLQGDLNLNLSGEEFRFLYLSFQPVQDHSAETAPSKANIFSETLSALRSYELYKLGLDSEDLVYEDFERTCGHLLVLSISHDDILAEMARHFKIKNQTTMGYALDIAADRLLSDYREITAVGGQQLHPFPSQVLADRIAESLNLFSLEAMEPDPATFSSADERDLVSSLHQRSKEDAAVYHQIVRTAVEIETVQLQVDEARQEAEDVQAQAEAVQQQAEAFQQKADAAHAKVTAAQAELAAKQDEQKKVLAKAKAYLKK